MAVHVSELDPTSDEELLAIQRLGMASDYLMLGGSEWRPLDRVRAALTDSDYTKTIRATARVNGEIVGFVIAMFPLKENTDRVHILEYIDRGFLRDGIDVALLEWVEGQAQALGRATFEMYSMFSAAEDPADPNHPHNRLAARFGLRSRAIEICRAAPLPIAPDRLAAVRQLVDSRPNDYELVSWVGPVPERFVAQVAALFTQLELDAPVEDVDAEPIVWTPERIRNEEAQESAGGTQRIACAALSPSGQIVGYSAVGMINNERTTLAWQLETIVYQEHRGHGLGLAMKLQTHTQLAAAAPQVRLIATWNSHVNDAMIRINEELGYRITAREVTYHN